MLEGREVLCLLLVVRLAYAYITQPPSGLRVEPRIIVLYAAYSRDVQSLHVIATLYASELFLGF